MNSTKAWTGSAFGSTVIFTKLKFSAKKNSYRLAVPFVTRFKGAAKGPTVISLKPPLLGIRVIAA